MIMPVPTLGIEGPVAIFGWGVSGQGAATLLQRLNIPFDAFDESGKQITRNAFTRIDAMQYRTIIYSPGFNDDHPWLKVAREAGCRCLGELEFAAMHWEGILLAVTGTNGKTTLCTFLAHAISQLGQGAVAAGNVGYPMSRVFDMNFNENPTAVCEISSFQAQSLECFKADALLWTNFAEDHLDRHPSMRHYFAAKWKLVESLNQSILIIGESVAEYAEQFGYAMPDFAQIIPENCDIPIPQDSLFARQPQSANYYIAHNYWTTLGYPVEVLEAAARSYKLPEHRLAKVTEIDGVEYWNDSKATNFASALAAIDSFDKPVYWIGGGKQKGGDIEIFANRVGLHVEEAFLIGESADIMSAYLRRTGCPAYSCETLDKAIAFAKEKAGQGSAVVFSPGFASFDQFDNYITRGLAFEEAVHSLDNLSTQPETNAHETA